MQITERSSSSRLGDDRADALARAGGCHRQQMRRAVVAQQPVVPARSADGEIARAFQFRQVAPIAEAGRAQQRAVPATAAAVELPDCEQDQACQQERHVGRDLTDAEDPLIQLLLAIRTMKPISSAHSGPIRAGISSSRRRA
ncbi:hypothetical protein ACU5AX_20215 [Sphingomonas sp. XXL09]|uniref:hypothetical protein n=1 Tax=Sphingomonas sp. XXL09 TaxID=3457787 RepID=UPI00406BB4AA